MIIFTGKGKIIYVGERVSVASDRLIAWILKLICALVLLFFRFFGDFGTREGWNKFSLPCGHPETPTRKKLVSQRLTSSPKRGGTRSKTKIEIS
jgi:hypothetical protein